MENNEENFNISAEIFLVDEDTDNPYYVVDISGFTTEFEDLEKMDLFLCNNFLCPYWVDEVNQRPQLQFNTWFDSLTYQRQIVETTKIYNRIEDATSLGYGPPDFIKIATKRK